GGALNYSRAAAIWSSGSYSGSAYACSLIAKRCNSPYSLLRSATFCVRAAACSQRVSSGAAARL
ncbi:hypothetical protein, partial [Burkholderia cenocepacia]|uniref:hypothetical protein n=1 Tax=Burkholderia cenocepacia TaxID=95486 RepID=UPI0024B71BB2